MDSPESGIAAQEGGAHRLELCSALREGGITASLGLLRTVRANSSLPLFAIVRPRGGDFLYSEAEFKAMQEDTRILTQEGVDGLVFGILTSTGKVDKKRTRALVDLAGPIPVTFHRALDMAADLSAAMEDVIECGVHRVLTSGGAQTAWDGRDAIRSLVEQAGRRTKLVVGGGVRPENIAQLMEYTGATEFHSSMRKLVRSGMNHQATHMSLGEAGSDEFSRSIVAAEDVRELIQAMPPKLPLAMPGGGRQQVEQPIPERAG